MLIPLKSDRPLTRPTRVIYVLVALNVLIAILVRFGIIQTGGQDLPGWYSALQLQRGESGWWTYVTYAFLHSPDDIWHILGNMLVLWVFGPNVEDRFGRLGFLVFYLVGAVLSGLAHVWASPSPVVGASGAVAGVTGAFLVLFPRTRIRSIFFFIIIGVYMVPSWFYVGLAVARDIFPWIMGSYDGVAHEAHLGGYAYGFAVSVFLLVTGILPREPYDLFQIAKQANRRREFRAAVRAAPGNIALKPDGAPKRALSPEAQAKIEAVAQTRAEVSRAVAEDRTDDAIDAYKKLAGFDPEAPPAPLSRNVQLAVASELYRRGEHNASVQAFSRFVQAYADDREADSVRVLMARIRAKHLNDTDAAGRMLAQVIESSSDPDAVEAAKNERESLGLGEEPPRTGQAPPTGQEGIG